MSGGGESALVANDSWTRFLCCDVSNRILYLASSFDLNLKAWFSQANHIFHRLHIMSNFEDYVLLRCIRFQLHISKTTKDPPEGFLFLCPEKDFRTGPSLFCWPACVGYWSLDPAGIDRLSMEDAARLGFPSFQLITKAAVSSWDATVYEGLQQFHQAKGFDPLSQDIARHLNHPLYQLSSQGDDSSAHDTSAIRNQPLCLANMYSQWMEKRMIQIQIGIQRTASQSTYLHTRVAMSDPEEDVHHPVRGDCWSELWTWVDFSQ
ncbi:hypothetical protein B0H12DRAFT_1198696 [Mycena haematopus]|nr:hypothetical protein B0H12DRAFT_1198696 [Mycena haematopus]